jgi:hypothetical protein
MNLFAFGGEDNTGSCSSTGESADCRAFSTSRNRTDDCSKARSACDDLAVAGLRSGRCCDESMSGVFLLSRAFID